MRAWAWKKLDSEQNLCMWAFTFGGLTVLNCETGILVMATAEPL